jgi:sugar lactone lactonase YvrE
MKACFLGVLLLAAMSASAEETWVFTNFAGIPPGAADGVGTAARFYYPWGSTFDANGNLFVADYGNNAIRKITPAGVVSTYAGVVGSAGSNDGPRNSARFFGPRDLAFDKAGNLYVSDTPAHTIRKITPDGTVSTLAGLAGQWGSVDGAGAAARFTTPAGIGVDRNGNVFVVDEFDNVIRKITPAGVATTFAGLTGVWGYEDGVGSAARFDGPTGLAVDANDNLFVTDTYNTLIRKVTPSAVVTTLAGSRGSSGSSDGVGNSASFYTPVALDIDAAGNLIVADGARVRKVTADGVVTTLAGNFTESGNADGTGTEALFQWIYGVAADAQGNGFVSDFLNQTIRRVTPAGVVTTFAGFASAGSDDGGPGVARFYNPTDVEVDASGNVFVADAGNNTIRKITAGGQVSTLAGRAGSYGDADGQGSAARFAMPKYLALGGGGELYVSDVGNATIRKVTPDGTVSLLAGSAGQFGDTDGSGTAARFGSPGGMAVDGGGNVIVADRSNNTIRKVTPAGVVSTLAGLSRSSGSDDGTGSAARFSRPNGVAIGPDGNIFVTDQENFTVRKLTPAGAVTTIAGSVNRPAEEDGQGSAASFYYPAGIGADAQGNLFVSDWIGSTIRRIDGAANVVTIAGERYFRGWSGGAGSEARFDYPEGLDVDTKGIVYVADGGTGTIRRGVRCTTGALCSLDGRFQLTLTARDPRTGNTGAGVPLQQNDLFGFFSIPALTGNAKNPEVFVKMLDGQGVNGNFWVFYGGLTDFEYTLTLKDTKNGSTKSYKKAGGSSAGGFDVGAGVTPEACAGEVDGVPQPSVAPAPCSAASDRLCLNEGRFRIEVVAKDPRTSASGSGVSIPQDDLFGYFALPALTGNPSNPEVFVKVLDGRPVNGFFWIFFSGLTDFQYTMTVTDTVTGSKKTYEKAGGSACGAFDVNAFK